ncbi:uncharacterized protein TNCT_411331 [Trichonephila clavata]|uniref:Uncharacterized protein n=1 Tax=Trichonephila clavata TaxID=2740835 RepID=A0A8X6H9F3_TRICU|nr:uncharacterized protein TNCT_411331 [Trichonephila clavata]
MKSEQREEWEKAMSSEIETMHNRGVWHLEKLPEDQEETDNSSPSKSCKEGNSNISQNMNTSPEHSYCVPVPRRSLFLKNSESNEKGFPFSYNKTSSFQKQSFQSISTQSSGANYLRKDCQDTINVPDNVIVKVNQLEEMRHQFATMNRHFSPISPLPPTPPPKNIVSKYNQPSKDLTAFNPYTMTVSSKQNSVMSDNQISQVSKTPSSSTPKKNQFCHQQSEGFEIPIEQLHNTSNLNPEDSKNGVLNVTSSDSTNCINLRFERISDKGVNSDIPCAAHFKIDLDNLRVSCYLGSNQNSSPKNSSSLPSETYLTNKQKDNVNSQCTDEGPCKKKPKVLIESPSSGGTVPEMNEFSYNDFPSTERSNQVFTGNHDISLINTSDKDILRKEPSINFSQSCANDCHNLETDVRSQIQSSENQVDYSRSSFSESTLPLKKKLKFSTSSQQYEKSLLENEERLSNFVLETTKTSHNGHMDQTEVQLKCNSEQKAFDSCNVLNVIGNIYDSTSKSEITPSLESKKLISMNSSLREKRNNLSPSNETLSIMPVLSTRKTYESKNIASISNSTSNYVSELETKSNYASAKTETMSENDRDRDSLKRSKNSSNHSKILKTFDKSKIETSTNLSDVKHLLGDSVAETTINKKNSLQNLSRISTRNVKRNESENIEYSISETNAVKSIENICDFEPFDEELFQEMEQNKELDVSHEKLKTLSEKVKNERISKVSSKDVKSGQPTRFKKDKNESLKQREKKQGKTKVKKKTSLKRQTSEFVNKAIDIETVENITISSKNPNPTLFSISTSFTDNLEHVHKEVPLTSDPKSEIVLNRNIPNYLPPNKVTDSLDNCSPKYYMNKAAEKSSTKTEDNTFLQDTYLKNSIKNDLDVNEKESKRTSTTCKELLVNGHVLDSNEFDSSTFNLPHDKIVEQEIKVNPTDEYSFLKTSGMISQNTMFSNENNSCLDKSNNLMEKQLSFAEINEFIKPENNSLDKSNNLINSQLSAAETNECIRPESNSWVDKINKSEDNQQTKTNEFTMLENNSLLDESNNLMDSQLSGPETNEFIKLESNSCLDKSNKLMGSQLSVTETNEFTRLKSNNSPIKIKSSPLNFPARNFLFEADDVDFSGLSIAPFNPDTFTNTRNMQVNDEFSDSKNILCSQNSDKSMNSYVCENNKLNKITSLETKTSEDQCVENIKINSFTLPASDGISTNPFLISPIKVENQYPNSKRVSASKMKELLNNGGQQEDRFVEIDREKSLSSFFKSDHVEEEINVMESSQLISKVSQNIENGMDTALDVESEMEITQGTSSRSSKKGQNFILSETELNKNFIGEQSASVNGDSKYPTDQVPSEIDSDYEPPLVIADVEVLHSSNDSEVEDSKKVAENSANESNLHIASLEGKIEMYSEENHNILSELPEIVKSVFQTVEKIKSSNARFKACLRNLVSVLTDPMNVENCQMLIYYLVIHLHLTKKNSMRSFSHGNNQDILLPLTENCFVTALFLIEQANKPHLAGLLTSTVNTLYRLILLKTEYHIYGLSSLCRVLTAICKQLKNSIKIKLLCYNLFKYNHKYTPFLIATMVGVWPEAFAVSSDSTEEEVFFVRAVAYGCGQKPRTLTVAQWKNSKSIFSKFLNVEELHFNEKEIVDYLIKKILRKALYEPTEDHFMLKGPFIIYSRIKGWNWTEKYILEKFILRSINSFKANEKIFIFLINFYVDLCVVFDEKVPVTYLSSYLTSSEAEFVRFYGGLALLKFICLSRTCFTSDLEKWVETYEKDSRARLCFDLFRWRMVLHSGLVLEDICEEKVNTEFV